MKMAKTISLCVLIVLGAAPCWAASAGFEWETFLNPNRPVSLTEYGGKVWMASGTGGVTVFDTADSSFSTIHRRPGGLVSNNLTGLHSDGEGRIWFATVTSGVSVLDVESGGWELLTSFEGLPSDTVTVLTGWGDSVWIGTPSGFAVFEGTDLKGRCNVLLPPGVRCPLGSHTMLAIAPVSDGAYLGTPLGVEWYDGETSTPLGDPGTPGFIVDLAVHDGELWALTTSGASRWDAGASEWAPSGLDAIGGKRALKVINGDLYAVTGEGVYIRDGGEWTRVGGFVNARDVAASEGGDLWGAVWNGLYLLDGNAWDYRPAPGPAFDDVRSVAVGPGGEVWFTGAGQTVGYDGEEWMSLSAATTEDRLQRCDVHGLLVDSSGRLWFGHCCRPGLPDSCLVDRLTRSVGSWNWRRFDTGNIWRIAEGGGSIWLGARYVGLYRIQDGNEEPEYKGAGDGLSSALLSTLAYDSGRGLWVGHRQAGVDLFAGEDMGNAANWRHVDESTGLLSDAVRKILVKGSEVWVGTLGGISVVDPSDMSVVRNYTVGPGGVTDRITDVSGMAVDGFGDVWVSTDGGGLYLIESGGTIQSFNTHNSPLSDDSAKDIAYDPFTDVVWVSTYRGITKVSRGTAGPGDSSAEFYVYPSPYCPGGCDAFEAGPLRIGGLPGAVDGEIVDLKGQLVARFFSAGPGDVIWSGTDSAGNPAGGGLYFVVARYGSETYRAKFAVLR
jgi:ligand-binding sensor domain-containing protein